MTAAPSIERWPMDQGADCLRCPLKARRPVPPARADNDKPKLIIVGMNPGRHEENRQTPFVGPSGQLLNMILKESGLRRSDCHITNAALCMSEDDQALKRAIPCCSGRLANELAEFDPKIPILTLGAEACRPTLGKASVMRVRGFVWQAPEIKEQTIRSAERTLSKRLGWITNRAGDRTRCKPSSPDKIDSARDSVALLKCRSKLQGRTVIASVHPAMILRGADAWVPVLRIDIGRAARWAKEPFALEDEVPFTETTDVAKAEHLLRKMGPLVNVDIETNGNDPMEVGITCVGVADVGHIEKWAKGKITKLSRRKIVVLSRDGDRPFVHPAMLAVLRRCLDARTVVTHNGPSFDEIALARHGVPYTKREDTLIAHYSFASDKPKSLAFVSSIYNASGPWKIRFKQGGEEKGVAGFGVSEEDLPKYNAADVALGSLAWIRMQPDLALERKVYEHDMRHALLCRKMQITGILIDQDRKKELSTHLRRRAANLLGQMRSLLHWRSFSPSKPNEMRKALFGRLRVPEYLTERTPTGLLAVNAKTLERLKSGANRAATLAGLEMARRKANDTRKEYLDNLHVAQDGRVHAHWRSYGAETGRPAVHKPNLLNVPRIQYCPGCGLALLDGMAHGSNCDPKKRREPLAEYQCRDIYIAGEGKIFIYYDLKQSEMVFAANLSGDQAFIEACKGDPHTANARVLFGGMPGALERLEDPKGKGKELRDIAKNCGFAIIYLAEAETVFTHLFEHGFRVDLQTCQDAIDRIRTVYWRYGQYVNENVALCQRQGFLRSAFLGRKRWLGHLPRPTEVANFPIQSGVADIMNARLGVSDERLPRSAHLLIYQYDSAIYEVPESDLEQTIKAINEIWSEPIQIPNGGEFIQKIDLKTGKRWSSFG